MHKDRNTKNYRVWLRPKTVQQARLLALILNRPEDWHMILDDMVRLGIFYLNKTADLQLTDWSGFAELINDQDNMNLRVVDGYIPDPDEYWEDD